MLTMGQIAKWSIDTLAADATFNALCVSTLGSALNYYRHTPVDGRVFETSPFITAYSNEARQDFAGNPEFRRTWELPFAMGYVIPSTEDNPVTDGSAKIWTSTDKVDIIAANAIEVLRIKAQSCGIYGESVIIVGTRVIVTEIGEADDIQANIFLTFGELNHI